MTARTASVAPMIPMKEGWFTARRRLKRRFACKDKRARRERREGESCEGC